MVADVDRCCFAILPVVEQITGSAEIQKSTLALLQEMRYYSCRSRRDRGLEAQRIDLPQGTLDLLILRTLSLEPQHGWAISERVQQVSSDVLQHPAGIVVSGAAPAGTARLDQGEMGHIGKQSPREVLRADAQRDESSLKRRPRAGESWLRRSPRFLRVCEALPCWNDLRFRLRALFRRNAMETELNEELRFHFEHEVEKYRQSGMTRRGSATARAACVWRP